MSRRFFFLILYDLESLGNCLIVFQITSYVKILIFILTFFQVYSIVR